MVAGRRVADGHPQWVVAGRARPWRPATGPPPHRPPAPAARTRAPGGRRRPTARARGCAQPPRAAPRPTGGSGRTAADGGRSLGLRGCFACRPGMSPTTRTGHTAQPRLAMLFWWPTLTMGMQSGAASVQRGRECKPNIHYNSLTFFFHHKKVCMLPPHQQFYPTQHCTVIFNVVGLV